MYQHSFLSNFFRSLISLNSLILMVLNYKFYVKTYAYKRLKNLQTSIGETFWTSREFQLCILTNLINLFHNPPYLETYMFQYQIGSKIRLSLSNSMAILMILRCYLILRLIPNLSKWTDIHAEECCEREGIRANFIFALKCLLKEKPYVMLLTYFALSIFGFAFSVRISEITYYNDPDYKNVERDSEDYQNYKYAANSIWLIIITMTTVGFGDLTPKTHVGRMIIMVSCINGMFLVS